MGGIFTGHPPQCPVTVAPLADHPLTAGSAPFTLQDEHYMMEMNAIPTWTFSSTPNLNMADSRPGGPAHRAKAVSAS